MDHENTLEADLTERLNWNVSSKVFVYSSSKNIFELGTIQKIYMDAKEEQMKVKHEDGGKISTVDRYSERIKPYSNPNPSLSAKKHANEDTFKIFKQNEDANITCDASKNDPVSCIGVERLLTALKHYSAFDLANDDDRNAFNYFMNEVYTRCIDDYTHLVTNHNEDLPVINIAATRIINTCDMQQCSFTSRHHSTDSRNAVETDSVLSFYKDTFDSLHFWLFHQYDTGLRVRMDELENNTDSKADDTDIEIRENEYYDHEFSRFSRVVSCRVRETQNLNRYSSASNDKFTLKAGQIQLQTHDHDTNAVATQHADDTYLDEILHHLSSNDVERAYIEQFVAMLIEDDFDSESIQYDLDDEQHNISICIHDDHFIETIKRFVKAAQLSSSSFNIGLRFYYWSWYESKQKIPDEEENADNLHDHSGFAVSDLYVAKKYANFKEEIAQYPSDMINMESFTDCVVTKVKEYMKSERVKASKACGGYTYGIREGYFHYDIDRDSTLGFDHLISVILYTDYTKLSSDFTASFRKRHIFETLQSMKRRNSVYYWWSKTLRETVEIYGGCKWGDGYYTNSGKVRNRIQGPFYTGMSFVMNLPAFNIRLCSPTSTSKQFTVAQRFSGAEGLILQFDNPDIEQFRFLRSFDCSWISQFREEDERLFFGGYHPIRVESVMLMESKQNFEPLIYLFNYFDKMCSGASRMDMRSMMRITAKDKMLIRELLDHVLGNETKHEYDPYILSSFECFCQSKQQITLNLWGFYEIDDKMSEIIMYPLEVKQQKDEKKRSADDVKNLFRPEIFKIFGNVQKITIVSTLFEGMTSCSLSLFGLLSLFAKSSSLTQIVVTAVSDIDGHNWIKSLLNASEQSIKKQYEAKQYIISVKKVQSNEYWLDITRTRKFDIDDSSNDIREEEEIEEENEDNVWSQPECDKKIVAQHYYTVQSKDSGLYWDLYDASKDNGAILLQYYYHGNNNQLYAFAHDANGRYTIHPMCSGKYIQVKDASTHNGAMIDQWDAQKDNKNQLFICEKVEDDDTNTNDVENERLDDGCYRFKSVQSGKYIDVPGCSKTEAFVPIQQWQSHKGKNQQFVIKRVDLEKRSIERGIGYVFEMTKHRHMDCWLYSWFWTKDNKKQLKKQVKQLKKNNTTIEEVISWLVKAYKNSNGPDPWMNCMKDATEDEVKGVINGLIQMKNQVSKIFYLKPK